MSDKQPSTGEVFAKAHDQVERAGLLVVQLLQLLGERAKDPSRLMQTGAFVDADDATNAAVAHLQWQGFAVIPPDDGDWITPIELRAKVGMSSSYLCAQLKHPKCPHFNARRGSTGRILSLRLNSALLAFLKRNQ